MEIQGKNKNFHCREMKMMKIEDKNAETTVSYNKIIAGKS